MAVKKKVFTVIGHSEKSIVFCISCLFVYFFQSELEKLNIPHCFLLFRVHFLVIISNRRFLVYKTTGNRFFFPCTGLAYKIAWLHK